METISMPLRKEIITANKKYLLFFGAICMFSLLLYYQLDRLVIVSSFLWTLLTLVFGKRKLNKNGLFYLGLMFLLSVILLLLTMLISPAAGYINIFVNVLAAFSVGFSSYSLGASFGNKEDKLDLIVNIIIVIGLINSLINIFSWIVQTGGIVARYNFHSFLDQSVSCNLGLSIIAALLILSKKTSHRMFKLILFLICISNVFFVMTRQKQVLALIYIALYVLFSNKKARIEKKLWIVLFATAVFVGLFFAFKEPIIKLYSGLLNSERYDNIQRELAIQDSIEMFRKSNFLGVGYGNFAVNISRTELASPHNGFYSVLSEFGIVGIAITIAFLAITAFTSLKTMLHDDNNTLVAISIIVLANTMLFFVSNFSFLPPPNERAYYLDMSILWIFYGIIMANKYRLRSL